MRLIAEAPRRLGAGRGARRSFVEAASATAASAPPSASTANAIAAIVQPASSPETVGTRPEGIAAGDLDGDADLDLAVANTGTDNVTILRNNGGGNFFETARSPVGAGDRPQQLVAADLDGDADRDLAVTDYDSSTVTILRNNGGARFVTWPPLNLSTSGRPQLRERLRSCAIADPCAVSGPAGGRGACRKFCRRAHQAPPGACGRRPLAAQAPLGGRGRDAWRRRDRRRRLRGGERRRRRRPLAARAAGAGAAGGRPQVPAPEDTERPRVPGLRDQEHDPGRGRRPDRRRRRRWRSPSSRRRAACPGPTPSPSSTPATGRPGRRRLAGRRPGRRARADHRRR